jgi:hypothetical protein
MSGEGYHPASWSPSTSSWRASSPSGAPVSCCVRSGLASASVASASTPRTTIEDAEAIALAGQPAVRIDGRLDSDEDFPDEHLRPLVYRRRRLRARRPRWTTLEEDVRARSRSARRRRGH